MKMNGVYFANKKNNNKAAQGVLAVFFAQATGLLAAVGLNLNVPVLGTATAFSLVLIFGSLWLVWGIRKMYI